MSDKQTSRRQYLKAVGVTGAVGVSGLSGCLGIGGGGGPIPMGSILPLTGNLGQYGEGMQEAVELAVQDVNDAGGPLGREIDLSTRNSETNPNVAAQRYSSLVSEEDIVGFVGAASSGVSVTIAEDIAGDEVMQVSNASTSPVLAEMGFPEGASEPKYFARTAPNDGQQGLVMGRILNDYIEADTAAFLYVNNAYGEGLADKAEAAFDGETLQKVGYASDTSDYTSTLNELHNGDPDGIGFVGYPGNGRTIVRQWADGGYGTNAEDWVLSEGLNSDSFINNNSSQVESMYMASPDPRDTEGSNIFQNKIGEANTLFAAHAYDAMFLQALAIHAGGSADGTTIAENIRSVSRSGNTTITVGEFDDAKEALDNDADIDYQGASSPVNLNPALEPLNPFQILQLTPGSDQIREQLESIDISWFQGRL